MRSLARSHWLGTPVPILHIFIFGTNGKSQLHSLALALCVAALSVFVLALVERFYIYTECRWHLRIFFFFQFFSSSSLVFSIFRAHKRTPHRTTYDRSQPKHYTQQKAKREKKLRVENIGCAQLKNRKKKITFRFSFIHFFNKLKSQLSITFCARTHWIWLRIKYTLRTHFVCEWKLNSKSKFLIFFYSRLI